MPNINAFRPMVHTKIFEDLSKFFLIQPLYLNKSESPSQACFLPVLVETGLMVLEKNIFKHFPIYHYVKI